jgi:cytoskeletal protein CcmA (bactofilin family)
MPEAAAPPLPAAEPEQALIAPGAEFEGLLLLYGPARIEGRLRGEIVGSVLWVGRAAALDARIEVDELIVSGAIAGSVRVRGRALLRATARVTANLEARSLALEDGSLLEGECRTGTELVDAAGAARGPLLP